MTDQLSRATRDKRAALDTYLMKQVRDRDEIKAVVVYGSVASGAATDHSDIDAVVFMDPVDHYLVPAEAIWNEHDGTYRSIFSAEHRPGDLQLDCMRVSWREWAAPDFRCADEVRARLHPVWVAFERDGYDAAALIRRLTSMTAQEQQAELDRALLACDDLPEDPLRAWERDSVGALDGLNAGWEALLRCVYAVNGAWFPYRGRAVRNLSTLAWAAGLDGDLLWACVGGGTDRDGYLQRAAALAAVKQAVLTRLADDPRYGDDPIFAAFLRAHDEPGRAWNLEEWNDRHRRR